MDCCPPPAAIDVELTTAEHDLAVRGFVALWHGQQPRPVGLDADPAAVDALQQRGLIVTDPDGRITGIHGLSTTPTAHRIRHPGGDIHTWCAFDAIGIPAALRLDAHTHTTCPTCGQHLDVTFTDGQPTAAADLRLWLPTTQSDSVLDDLCAHARPPPPHPRGPGRVPRRLLPTQRPHRRTPGHRYVALGELGIADR